MAQATNTNTHEDYIQAVRTFVLNSAATLTDDEKAKLAHTKLMYGVGQAGVRGVCYYESWQNGIGKVDVVEVSAQTQENFVQLTGTTVHELAHVLAGHAAGHGPEWKEAATRLGFAKKPEAAGQRYMLAQFNGSLRTFAYTEAARIAEGMPAFQTSAWLAILGGLRTIRPCSAGNGSKGGTSYSRGRMRLWECVGCPKPIKVRVASDDFQATCNRCGTDFVKR
jgi:hypothetical protein